MVLLLLQHLWKSRPGYIQDSSVFHTKRLIQRNRRKNEEKTRDDSQFAMDCQPNSWNDSRTQRKNFWYKYIALSAHASLSFLSLKGGQRSEEILFGQIPVSGQSQQERAESLQTLTLLMESLCSDNKDLMTAWLWRSRTQHSTQTHTLH